jgi:hypothetical protein
LCIIGGDKTNNGFRGRSGSLIKICRGVLPSDGDAAIITEENLHRRRHFYVAGGWMQFGLIQSCERRQQFRRQLEVDIFEKFFDKMPAEKTSS